MTLVDSEIAREISSGGLILNADKERIGPACYELRMGPIYYDLTEGDRRVEVGEGQKILIKPGHRVVLITLEKLLVPADMFARVASKGSLFSIGLSPVCTYADPGFQGNLGIVTQNISDKYIELPIGEPIAKIDFTRLLRKVDHPYQGQHGFQAQIWPIKHHLQKDYGQVKGDPRVESEKKEAYKLLPAATARMLRRMERRQRTIDIAILAAVLINAVMLAVVSTKLLDTTVGLVGNLIATAIAACFVLVTGKED
jgi:dCTP deaminase